MNYKYIKENIIFSKEIYVELKYRKRDRVQNRKGDRKITMEREIER